MFKNKRVLLIFSLALAVRIFLFVLSFHANHWDLTATISGADGYFEISRNLFLGNGFSTGSEAPFMPNVIRPPLYPFFITAILYLFRTYWAVLALQITISALIPVLGFGLAQKIFKSNKISFLTALFLAIEPHGVELSYVFMTETLFIFLLFVCLYYLFKYFDDYDPKDIILSSLFLGLTTLTWPIVQYLPFFVGFLILWTLRKNIKTALYHTTLLAAVFVLVISPWLYRNYKLYGTLGLTTQAVYNFYTYLAPSVLAIRHGSSFPIERHGLLGAGYDDNKSITLSNSNYFLKKGWDVVKKYPGDLLKSLAATEFTFFTHDNGVPVLLGYAGLSNNYHFPRPPILTLFESPGGFFAYAKHIPVAKAIPLMILLAVRLLWLILTLLFFGGIIRLYRHAREKITSQQVISIFLVFYFALVSIINGLGINARFRLPVEIFIFAFALYFLRDHRKEHNINQYRLNLEMPGDGDGA